MANQCGRVVRQQRVPPSGRSRLPTSRPTLRRAIPYPKSPKLGPFFIFESWGGEVDPKSRRDLTAATSVIESDETLRKGPLPLVLLLCFGVTGPGEGVQIDPNIGRCRMASSKCGIQTFPCHLFLVGRSCRDADRVVTRVSLVQVRNLEEPGCYDQPLFVCPLPFS